MVAMSDVTEDACIIFAKNTDRQANEPLATRYVPAATHPVPSRLRTTYMDIEQVNETNACILFSPTNIFGAEMGFNAHGLVMGNEALFTKIPADRPRLTGMDLVRLVLERCSSSEGGKNTLVRLLQRYGQGGNAAFTSSFSYQNSFLIVDSREAWLIETVGTEYAAKRITSGIRTISNRISFGHLDTFDEHSPNLIKQAIDRGWCTSDADFHFGQCYSGFSFNPKHLFDGWIKTTLASSEQRQCRSAALITNRSKLLTVADVFSVLRDHCACQDSPGHGLTTTHLCMHAAFGPIRFSQTTGALVSRLPTCSHQLATHYGTCTSLPCLSLFKPLWLDSSSLPLFSDDTLLNPTITYSSNNLWWNSEIMSRNVMKYYSELIDELRSDRDRWEQEMLRTSHRLATPMITSTERKNYSIHCFQQADQWILKWFRRAHSLSCQKHPSEYSLWQEFTWNRWRQSARIPVELLEYSKVRRGEYLLIAFFFVFFVLLIFANLGIHEDD